MNTELKDYKTPDIEVVEIVNEDVITASGDLPGVDVDLGGEGK